MTKIVVEELKTGLEQTFSTNYKMQINSLNYLLYKDLNPSGNFYAEIWQGGAMIAQSVAVTSLDIEASTDSTNANWYHGYYRFIFSGIAFVNRGNFTLKLTQSGYTFNENAYIGWVKPHDNIEIEIDYVVTEDRQNPFGVQIWTYGGKMTRIVDIDDGFTAATEPTIGATDSTSLASYANDAAFESANTVKDGSTYYNSTDHKERIYENGAWVENASFEA